MAVYQIVGVYTIKPTEESILAAVEYHEMDFLLDEAGRYTDPIRWVDLENLALVELQTTGIFSTDDLYDAQHGEEAAYMEYYLESTGTTLIPEEEAEQVFNPRVCFFLHHLDLKQPLQFGRQRLKLPAPGDLPERLLPFTHYIPPNGE